MAKDFPGGAFTTGGGDGSAFPVGNGAFTPKVVPMAPASAGDPKTPWLRPVPAVPSNSGIE